MRSVLLLLVQATLAIHDHSGLVAVAVDHVGRTETNSTVGESSVLNFSTVGRLLRRDVKFSLAALPPDLETESRRVATLATGFVGVLVYMAVVVGLSSSEAKANSDEDRSLMSALPEAVPWMILSMSLSIFNKWIFLSSGGDFPFPMTLSCCHMGATTVSLHLLRLWRPQLFPHWKLNWELARIALLVGSLLAVSVVLSNSAAVLLSVAFVNMLKGGNPVVALFLSLVLGLALSKATQLLWPVLIIMTGAIATIHGELYLSHLGLALLVTAILVEQFRLIVFKSMMSGGHSLDPLSALALFAPVALCGTLPCAAYEWRHSAAASDASRSGAVQVAALALNAMVAVSLNIAYSRLLKVASPVTFTVFGTFKDVTTAGLSLLVVGGVVTPQQLCGYGVTLIGMVYYDRIKQSQ
ncbi:unnamed protein product [Effrenium voratum]|nr:unnamed protein product [Effrenium voratum]